MKHLLVCLSLVLALSPSLGWAGNANGGGAGDNGGNAYGHDNGNNGNAYGHDNGNNGNSGNAPGHDGDGDDGGPILSPGGQVTIGPDQNQALDAVDNGAMPLSDIAARAVAQWGGRVIDAKLLRRNGALLYRLTILNDQGVTRRVLYDAKSGAPLRGQ